MFGMWEGKVEVVILTTLTQSAEITTGWFNELWDTEAGTEQAGKTVKISFWAKKWPTGLRYNLLIHIC